MVIRVLVASAVRAYREGLRRVLQGAEGIALVGIAATAEQVVEQACKFFPSVILLDIDVAKRLARANQFGGTPRIGGIVIIGTPEAYEDVVACLPAEVLAFVAYDATVADLMEAIRAAGGSDGGPGRVAHQPIVVPPIPPAFAPFPVRTPATAIAHLTEREMEILRLIQQGLPNKMISRHLGIELSTVKNHVHSILAKLGAHNRGEAISLLYRHENSGIAAQAAPVEPVGEVILPLDQPAIA
jgi:two-component system, NarL family, nitrate/nitrite response regulator NarL